jgi:hypothetical protein
MKTYRSPIYPALAIRLPGTGRNMKATGGYFEIADEDVEAFEKVMAERPHYQVTSSDGRAIATDTGAAATPGAEHGTVTRPEPMSASEQHPELASVETLETLTVPQLRERLEGLELDTTGTKNVLINRLAEATNVPTGGTESDANPEPTNATDGTDEGPDDETALITDDE